MITGAQIRAARALVRWTVEDLAKGAKVGVMTVRRAEANDGPVKMLPNNLSAIRAALEAAGVIFQDENGEGPGVRLRKTHKGVEIMKKVEPHKIESKIEADDYLKDLLKKDECRSMKEVEMHAQERIEDERLKNYFINKGKEMLKA